MNNKCSLFLLEQEIDSILDFLGPFLSFANCHMVDFFINSCYKNFIPAHIQRDLAHIEQENVTDIFFERDLDNAPNLKNFVENCERFTLRNCTDFCLSLDDFLCKLQLWGCYDVHKFKLQMFMSMKKSHEVEILSGVVTSVFKLLDASHLIDIGDGKGYLSSMLALRNKISVIGIDSSEINTCGAHNRAYKLSKIWNNIPSAPRKSYKKKNENDSKVDFNLYKQVTAFVDETFDLEKLIIDCFVSSSLPLRLGVVGLHTCGNLSPDSLKIFSRNDVVKFVCNVGCCYHLLTEHFDETNSNNDNGFPMSNFLRGKKILIGRSARMIANQSVDRILAAKEMPNITIFYRALLQVLLQRHCVVLPTRHVGKFRKQPKNFVEYVQIALKRLNVYFEITDRYLEEFYLDYSQYLSELNIFYMLRCRLSPVIESLILLDRLLFIKEQGFEDSFIVQFFDPVVSPRCYGIVAMKELAQSS